MAERDFEEKAQGLRERRAEVEEREVGDERIPVVPDYGARRPVYRRGEREGRDIEERLLRELGSLRVELQRLKQGLSGVSREVVKAGETFSEFGRFGEEWKRARREISETNRRFVRESRAVFEGLRRMGEVGELGRKFERESNVFVEKLRRARDAVAEVAKRVVVREDPGRRAMRMALTVRTLVTKTWKEFWSGIKGELTEGIWDASRVSLFGPLASFVPEWGELRSEFETIREDQIRPRYKNERRVEVEYKDEGDVYRERLREVERGEEVEKNLRKLVEELRKVVKQKEVDVRGKKVEVFPEKIIKEREVFPEKLVNTGLVVDKNLQEIVRELKTICKDKEVEKAEVFPEKIIKEREVFPEKLVKVEIQNDLKEMINELKKIIKEGKDKIEGKDNLRKSIDELKRVVEQREVDVTERKVEVFPEKGLIEFGERLVGRRFILTDAFLEQQKGAVIEADKLYIEAKNVEESGGSFIGNILDKIGFGDVMGGGRGRYAGKIGSALGRYGKWLGLAGLIGGGVIVGIESFKEGKYAQGIGRMLGGIGGGLGGAKLGAVVGTMIAPGVGTVIGSILGGVAGFIGGDWIGKRLGELVEKIDFGELVEKVKEGFERIGSIFLQAISGLVDIVKSIGRGVAEGAKKAAGATKELASRGVETAKEWASKVSDWMQAGVGWVARIFETGKAYASEASSVVAKTKEYIGMWQFTEQSARDFLKKYGFEEQFKGLKWMSGEWVKKWEELSQKQEFVQAQLRYGIEKYMVPGLQVMREFGIKSPEASATLREMAMARTVQLGVGGFRRVLRSAFAGLTKEQIANLPAEEIVKGVYSDLRKNVDVYFRTWLAKHPEGRAGLLKRFEREESMILAQLRAEREGKLVPGDIERELDRMRTNVTEASIKVEKGVRGVTEKGKVDSKEWSVVPFVEGKNDIDKVPFMIDDIGVLLVLLGAV